MKDFTFTGTTLTASEAARFIQASLGGRKLKSIRFFGDMVPGSTVTHRKGIHVYVTEDLGRETESQFQEELELFYLGKKLQLHVFEADEGYWPNWIQDAPEFVQE